MKKLLLFVVFCLSASASGKNIPSPFWFNISEKILAGTHQLISPDESPKTVLKPKAVKATKPIRVPLKCQPKEKNILPLPSVHVSCDGIWTVQE
jgi:hypothetical protein